MNTIFALSTLLGKSGVSVIRISGEHALDTARAFYINTNLLPRKAHFCMLKDPITNDVIDEGLVIYFPAPNSFTGEDVIEFQLHGSLAVIQRMIDVLSLLPYLRIAEPGEFSKRAFENGKLDLTKAEGLAMLLDAETDMQRKIALKQMQGALENLYDRWRQKLIKILAQIEAFIDFPEDDIPQAALSAAYRLIDDMIVDIEQHLASSERGQALSNGVSIAIIGPPNVGKSTLLNAIARREVAIVSSEAGTTRDVIELRLNLNGYLVTFYDTAGIRDTDNKIESEGIRRSIKTLNDANITLFIFDNDVDLNQYTDYLENANHSIVVVNKMDMHDAIDNKFDRYKPILISAHRIEDVNQLLDFLKTTIATKYAYSEEPVLTKARYKNALKVALNTLKNLDSTKSLEIIAQEVKIAVNYLGTLTGRIDIEEVLDEIFSNFCIGK